MKNSDSGWVRKMTWRNFFWLPAFESNPRIHEYSISLSHKTWFLVVEKENNPFAIVRKNLQNPHNNNNKVVSQTRNI